MIAKIYSGLRVYLSTLSVEDADDIAENANDKEIAYRLGAREFPSPYERSHALNFIEAATQKMLLKEEAHFGIHLAEGGKLIGVEGYNTLDFANRKGEIGYWIGRKYWGNGYGKEAASLLIRFGFEILKLHRIEAKVFDFNSTSKALLKSLGFSLESTMQESYFDGSKYLNENLFVALEKDYKISLNLRIEGELPLLSKEDSMR
ncbi:MAG: GNAT family N-acetyltransferase [Candidatus Micrarchaeia archaeon]